MDATSLFYASCGKHRRPSVAARVRRCRQLVALILTALPSLAPAFDSGRAEFALQVNDLEIPYRIFAVYVLPGETLSLSMGTAEETEGFDVVASSDVAPQRSAAGWRWRAPEISGLSQLVIARGGDRIDLNIVVMVPSHLVRDERLNGFRIGSYPAEPLNGNPLYLTPDGYIELTEPNAGLQLSPHFRLGQFPSKQVGGFPKYLVLREQLLLKLELLLEAVNRDGRAVESFTIMSGYRTPFYNAAIKNVPYSRHVYGGAADIYIDEAPRDGVMDDLNGDGRIDYRDAQRLFRIAERLFSDTRFVGLRGGMGVYRQNAAHGPFIHIDARQQRARWGLLP